MSMTNVLVVDDAVVDQRLVAGLLARQPELRTSFARDGVDALRAMAEQRPDVVVTDLRMPRMDGLELVRAVRKRYPGLPVVLMTAQGSEQIAVEALKAGAASYVPKSRLAEDLLGTIEQVVTLARAAEHQERLWQRVTRLRWELALENDPSLVAALVTHLRDATTLLGMSDEVNQLRLSVALEEALLNALYHGNLEVSSELRESDAQSYYRLADQRRRQPPYCERKIYVEAEFTQSEVTYVVRDEGPGFNPQTLPDPTDPANLERISGRGLLLIRTFMDEVCHNPAGNEIRMVKRFHAAAAN
jgi:CheY-like chemotaxis protein/anti-sigma regulatory factor (Ser/Thr protein kinase)